MVECGVVHQLRNEFKNSVQVMDDSKNLRFIFKGPRSEVAKAKSRLSELKLVSYT